MRSLCLDHSIPARLEYKYSLLLHATETGMKFICMGHCTDNTVNLYLSKQMVEVQSLWAKQTAVVVFLRRFGWQLCRLWSTELSSVKPQLDAHNVRLCGVGLEELGLEEFQEGQFFTGGQFYIMVITKCTSLIEMDFELRSVGLKGCTRQYLDVRLCGIIFHF